MFMKKYLSTSLRKERHWKPSRVSWYFLGYEVVSRSITAVAAMPSDAMARADCAGGSVIQEKNDEKNHYVYKFLTVNRFQMTAKETPEHLLDKRRGNTLIRAKETGWRADGQSPDVTGREGRY